MSDAEEEEDMEHDAGASSGDDAGSEDGSSQGEEEASSSSEEEVEPRVLPNRTTRGSKMGKLVEEEEDDADKEFWQQDFFQEEEKDEEWETSESESGDEPDTDFDEPEDEGEDEEEGREPTERRQKRLAPPGAKKKASRPSARKAGASPRGDPSERPARRSAPAVPSEVDAPKLRASTRARVEVAEQERARQEAAQQEMMAKRRSKSMNAPEVKPLTQEELLAEAAKTELENARSLQLLLAREEEVKRRNAVKATKYAGPIVRYHSKRIGKDTEQTRLELLNMREAPAHLQPQRAPPHPQQPVCQITGLPAKYRHPATGTPYATLEAYAQIERHAGRLHAAGRPSAKRRHDGDLGSDFMAAAPSDAKRQRAQADHASAMYRQSGGFAAGHMHMAGGHAAEFLAHNGTF